jgi:hypothetical protein
MLPTPRPKQDVVRLGQAGTEQKTRKSTANFSSLPSARDIFSRGGLMQLMLSVRWICANPQWVHFLSVSLPPHFKFGSDRLSRNLVWTSYHCRTPQCRIYWFPIMTEGHAVAWLRHYATSRKVADSIPDEITGFFFNWTNPSSRTMVLGLTQPLTEMSTRNLPGGIGRPARTADNLTAICEPTV